MSRSTGRDAMAEDHPIPTGPAESQAAPLVPCGRRRHPALLVAIVLAGGIVLGDRMELIPLVWITLALGFAAISVFARRFRQGHLSAVLAIIIVVCALGAWRISVENSGRPSLAFMELAASPNAVEGFGRLAGVPYRKSSGWRVPFDLQAIRGPSGVVPLRARLLLTTRDSLSGFRHGDYLRLAGRFQRPFVKRNPGGFDYAEHLFRQGIDGLVRPVGAIELANHRGTPWHPENLIEPVRRWIRDTFDRHLPAQASAVMLGLILGDTDRLSTDIFSAFRGSGTLHLLAVSGANVWLVVGVFLWPLRLLSVPRWPRTIILLVIVVAFSFLTRNEPSVVRASLVVGLILVGNLAYRPIAVLNAVGVAGALILLVSPSQLFRPGFQLSFAAVIAIAIIVTRLRPLVRRVRNRWVRGALLVMASSAAAGVATAPIVAAHFGTVPIMGIPANLLMVPLAGVMSQLGVLLLAAGLISSTIAGFLGIPIAFLTTAAIGTAQSFADLPGAVLAWTNPGLVAIISWYVLLVIPLAWRHRYRWLRPLTYTAVGIMIVSVMRSYWGNSPPTASISLLDVGRDRVVSLADGRGNAIWIADEPGIDDDLSQWVVEPFARARGDLVTLPESQPWRYLPAEVNAGSTPLRSSSPEPVRWSRFLTESPDFGTDARIWVDLFAIGPDTILWIRDFPDADSAGDWPQVCLGPEHSLIVPGTAADAVIREAVETLRPAQVIMYGDHFGRQYPDQRLALWRLRFPSTEFWSSSVHGGLTATFGQSGITITPTIPETSGKLSGTG